ncbi:putative uncharacterized protein DDB_G0291812 [Chrysoperla carnea]|uniref:putative uncharacterized protein DDB_G0291812 n=1 Tax=Chrysoperla carnea TaxID=189513 RepID=UPI001D08C3D6|nr:putative uncharacterized protein DDB_G0291812 [Chrysoperla carnea]
MDITETFRTEDISKTDFFDFVIAPDNNQSFQSFTKQMRAVNVYLEDDNGDPKIEPNNNTLIIDQDHQTLNSTTLDVTNSTLNSSSISTSYDPLFWNCDKETVRLETAILEDLNKYCWSQDTTDTIVTNNINNANSGSSCDTANNNNNPKLLNNNTDGHIYTLTVLNGVEQTHWYRPPTTLLSHQSIVKDDHDGSLPAPSPMEHIPQPQLDIDSILNIIPNGYNNNYDQQTLSPHNTVQLTTDGLIKSETFTYDDSGYADTKDEITNALMIDTPMLEAHDNFNNNNNNDWKTDNNNTNNNNDNNNNNSNSNNNNTNSNNSSGNTAESLLRSALQGKTFLRYQKKTLPHSESHSELRRALSTPPSKTEELPPSATTNDHQMMTLQLSNNNIILFDNSNQMIHHPESSTQSMDDLLLSQLDTTSYPVEDYEKLKHIANEVVESVQQYCQLDRVAIVDANNIYVNASDLQSLGGGNNTEIIAPVTTTSSGATIIQTTNINPSPPTTNLSTITTAVVTSSKPTTKKYKRTNSNSSTKQNTNNNNNMQTNVQTATSTSNGVRKERSLHYCSICSKGFKDKYSVNVHIRTHTGEKPFACSLCGKSFRQKAHLAKHYQTHIAQKNAAANATNSTTITTPISINSISTSASVTCTPMTPTTNVITTSR